MDILMKGLFLRCIPIRIPNHRAPNPKPPISHYPPLKLTFSHLKMDGWKLEDDPFLFEMVGFFSGANFCSFQEAVAGCGFFPVPFGFFISRVGPYLRSATDGGRLLPSSLQCRQVGRTSRQRPEVGDVFFHLKKKGFPNKKLGLGLGGGFKYFLFSALFGEDSHFA